MDKVKQQREWMKSNFHVNDMESDQELELPQPPIVKAHDENGEIITLPDVNKEIFTNVNVYDVFEKRVSRRKYSDEYMSLEELSFLLWTTQGVKSVVGKVGKNVVTRRRVPSAGARHPFETYLAINKVQGLKNGLYRYLPLNHELIFLNEIDNLQEKLVDYTLGQKFVKTSAVTFLWTAVPYRSEWRYTVSAHKVMLLDAGHVCQNLYLACEILGLGTCAIAAYNQDKMDELLNLDGEDEFVVYLAPVGKCK